MSCRPTQRRLSALIDDELTTGEASLLKAHLVRCPECRAAANQLHRLKRAMRDLDRLEPPVGIFERSLHHLERGPARGTWLWPTIGGSLALAATLTGVVLWMDVDPPWAATGGAPAARATNATARPAVAAVSPAVEAFDAAELHYRDAVQSLRRIARRESGRWRAAQREKLEGDLRLFDAALERSRSALEIAPVDPQARELHFAAYRHQIRYLQEAILGAVSDGPRPKRSLDLGTMPVLWQP